MTVADELGRHKTRRLGICKVQPCPAAESSSIKAYGEQSHRVISLRLCDCEATEVIANVYGE
jgi:hypothetical protein